MASDVLENTRLPAESGFTEAFVLCAIAVLVAFAAAGRAATTEAADEQRRAGRQRALGGQTTRRSMMLNSP